MDNHQSLLRQNQMQRISKGIGPLGEAIWFFHIPGFKSRLGKINLRYNGVIVWNNILSGGVPAHVSQAVFSKQLKCAMINGTL